VVLQKQLVHTTLASQLHVVNAAAVTKATRQAEEEGGDGDKGIPLSKPLPKVHKKVLEERERKALRQAEESFRHINQKVRLVLECVAWVSVIKSSEY
jgi:protein LSM12